MQKLLNEMPMCATPPRVPRRPCGVGELLAGLLQPGHVACYLSCADTAMLRAVCSATQLSPLAAWSGHPPFPAVLDSPVRSDRCMDAACLQLADVDACTACVQLVVVSSQASIQDSASLASPASTRCLELQAGTPLQCQSSVRKIADDHAEKALLTSPRIRNPSATESHCQALHQVTEPLGGVRGIPEAQELGLLDDDADCEALTLEACLPAEFVQSALQEVAGLQAADCEARRWRLACRRSSLSLLCMQEVAGLQAALDSSGVYCISDEEPAASLPGSDIVQGPGAGGGGEGFCTRPARGLDRPTRKGNCPGAQDYSRRKRRARPLQRWSWACHLAPVTWARMQTRFLPRFTGMRRTNSG